jgi:tRNA U38,U39,U40 pseudouridine synthase TruA
LDVWTSQDAHKPIEERRSVSEHVHECFERVGKGKGETQMTARTTPSVSAAKARTRLNVLLEERNTALRTPLAANRIYMDDLEADIAASRAAFVGAAVTELCILRAEVFGRQYG